MKVYHDNYLVVHEPRPGLNVSSGEAEDVIAKVLLTIVQLHLQTGHLGNAFFRALLKYARRSHY